MMPDDMILIIFTFEPYDSYKKNSYKTKLNYLWEFYEPSSEILVWIP